MLAAAIHCLILTTRAFCRLRAVMYLTSCLPAVLAVSLSAVSDNPRVFTCPSRGGGVLLVRLLEPAGGEVCVGLNRKGPCTWSPAEIGVMGEGCF